MSPPDRLSALDAAFLDLDTERAPLHVGWTLRFGGAPPSLAALRRHVDSRLGSLPRFRRRVVMPAFGLGDPHWTDDATFDVGRHVHELRLASPAGVAQLRDVAGVLLSTPLDLQRPLWRLQLVTGLEDGFALVGQAHHAMVDGMAAIEVATLLLSPAGSPQAGAASTAWAPARATPPASAVAAALRARAGGAHAARSLLAPGAATPGAALRRLARTAADAPQAVGALAALTGPAAPTALDHGLTRERRVAFACAPLEGLRASARRHDATINDMLLAASSVAIGAALRRRGERHESVRALVPASTRAAGENGAEHGNRIAFMALDLPAGEPELTRVLQMVRARSAARKRSGETGAADALLRATDALPPGGRRQIARAAARAARFTVIVSNVPGPPIDLELLGRPLEGAWPAVPLLDGHALTIGAMSYGGRLFAGIYADAVIVPDTPQIARDVEVTLTALASLERVRATPWRARARVLRDAQRAASR